MASYSQAPTPVHDRGKISICQIPPGLPPCKGLLLLPTTVPECQELPSPRGGRKGSTLGAMCCAGPWVLTHFPHCAAVLGISQEVVLCPVGCCRSRLALWPAFLMPVAGAHGPTLTSHCEVSGECDFLIPKQTYPGPWVPSAFLHPLTKVRNTFGSLPCHTKATGNCAQRQVHLPRHLSATSELLFQCH